MFNPNTYLVKQISVFKNNKLAGNPQAGLQLFISKKYVLLFVLLLILGCKQKEKTLQNSNTKGKEIAINYAEGFKITEYNNFKIITVTEAWPDSDQTFKYALLKEETSLPDSIKADAVVHIPIKSIVVTSTTHIPSLEMLGVENTLVGFPNLDYISSPKTRSKIAQNKVLELGQNESINTETTLELNPDLIVSFGVEGQNKALNSLERAGIPIAYNGDWVEHQPLGKAEWIKFFAAFYDKQDLADSIFKTIANKYEEVKTLANKADQKPTVLSGAMFKDVWYLPHGDSWAAKLIKDANADYLYKDSKGTGSIALSLEEVLDKGQKADFWIAPNSFDSYSSLNGTSSVYSKFKAFQDKKVYGFASAKGETGGLLYYEVAPNRPDWVLQDLVHIFHPSLLPDYKPHFFQPLAE